jgi:hypothetical protein
MLCHTVTQSHGLSRVTSHVSTCDTQFHILWSASSINCLLSLPELNINLTVHEMRLCSHEDDSSHVKTFRDVGIENYIFD